MLSSTFPLLSIQLSFLMNTGSRVAQLHRGGNNSRCIVAGWEPFSPPPACWQRLPRGDGEAGGRCTCDCMNWERCYRDTGERSEVGSDTSSCSIGGCICIGSRKSVPVCTSLGHEVCMLMAHRMFCVSLCSPCKRKKDCIEAIGNTSSSNMLNKFCALFMRL